MKIYLFLFLFLCSLYANKDSTSCENISKDIDAYFDKRASIYPFSKKNSKSSWGLDIATYPKIECKNSEILRELVEKSYKLALDLKLNYCHHHSPFWHPKNSSLSVIRRGDLKNSFFCSNDSFRPQNINLRDKSSSAKIKNAYRWNSNYAKNINPNWNKIVKEPTKGSKKEMEALLKKLYIDGNKSMIDKNWFDTKSLYDGNSDKNLNRFLYGFDCSNFTEWVYAYAYGESFSSGISTQAGQITRSKNKKLEVVPRSAKYLHNHKNEQSRGAAGELLVDCKRGVIDREYLKKYGKETFFKALKKGDLIFIQNRVGVVTHVAIYSGKRVSKPGSGINDNSVALEFIAPSDPINGMSREVGDYVIIDSHFQGVDYRTFSGWYESKFWGVRRVIFDDKSKKCVNIK